MSLGLFWYRFGVVLEWPLTHLHGDRCEIVLGSFHNFHLHLIHFLHNVGFAWKEFGDQFGRLWDYVLGSFWDKLTHVLFFFYDQDRPINHPRRVSPHDARLGTRKSATHTTATAHAVLKNNVWGRSADDVLPYLKVRHSQTTSASAQHL